MLSSVVLALDDLRKAAAAELAAAQATAGDSSSSASSSTAAPQQAAMLEGLRQALAGYEAALPSGRRPAAHLWRPVLPAARTLAAALLYWWRRPAAQQEQQLDAAQAAAARSCASVAELCLHPAHAGFASSCSGWSIMWHRHPLDAPSICAI